MADDLSCRIYIDFEGLFPALMKMAEEWTQGRKILSSTFASALYEADVEKNAAHKSARKEDPQKGFLAYRYTLWLEPKGGVNKQAYVEAVGALLARIQGAGHRAVALCGFEEELRAYWAGRATE